jgi:6-phosphogluconolactonase
MMAAAGLLLSACGESGSSSPGSVDAAQQTAAAGTSTVSTPESAGSASSGAGTTNSGSSSGSSSGISSGATATSFAYVASISGIYCYAIDASDGGLQSLNTPLCDSGPLPAVATDPLGQFVYAVDPGTGPEPGSMTANVPGTVRAYQIDSSTGALTRLAPDIAAGMAPISITVDPKGRFVYVVNSGADSVSAYVINAATGALTAVPGSPFATGHLPNTVVIDPSGSFLYTADDGSDDVWGFAIDPSSGALAVVPGSPFPTGNATSITIDPAGKFVFVANLLTADVSAFAINHQTGTLSAVAGSPFSAGCTSPLQAQPGAAFGNACRLTSLAVDASGAFLYATGSSSNTISGFAIDPTSGALASLAGSPFTVAPWPYSVTASGGFLYVSYNDVVGAISTYTIDPSSGVFTPVEGSNATATAATGGTWGLAIAP